MISHFNITVSEMQITQKQKMELLGMITTIAMKHDESVKHGHWIGKPLAGYSTVKCSVCGSAFVENNGKWKYCPWCGSKLDEVVE